MNLNKVIIMGHLTRDPELRYTTSGTAVAGFSIAINHAWRTPEGELKEEVTFVECSAWGKTAENLAQYKKKGGAILVEGRLKQETWDDRETGAKRSKIKVVAEKIVYVGSAPDGASSRTSAPRQRNGAAAPVDNGYQPDAVGEEDVPF